MIRPASRDDLATTATIHRRSLGSGFFARLGPRFLRRYHETFVSSPQAVALVAVADDEVVGVILGTTDNAAHYRWVMRQRGKRLALAGLLALLIRPRELVTFLRTRTGRYLRAVRRMVFGSSSAKAPATPGTGTAPAPDVAVLTHVAVDPSTRADGLGRALVEAFVEACELASSSEIRLVTDHDDGAAGFYRTLGWEHVTDRPAADGTFASEFRLQLREPTGT